MMVPLIEASPDRDRVSRKRIRAALARIPLPNSTPSDIGATARLVYNAFSGFVLRCYVHILEQYDGLRYRTKPSTGHPRADECVDTLTDYVCRACAAGTMVAIRCRDSDVDRRLRAAMDVLVAGTACVPTDEESKGSARG